MRMRSTMLGMPRRRLSTHISSIAQPPATISATIKRFEQLSGKLTVERSVHVEQLAKAIAPSFMWLQAHDLLPTSLSRPLAVMNVPEQLKLLSRIFEKTIDGSEVAFQIVRKKAKEERPCFADLVERHAIDRSLSKVLSSSGAEDVHLLQNIGGAPVVRSVDAQGTLLNLRAMADGPVDAKVVLCDTTILNTSSGQRPDDPRVHFIAHGKRRPQLPTRSSALIRLTSRLTCFRLSAAVLYTPRTPADESSQPVMCTYVADAHGHGTQLTRWLLACIDELADNSHLKAAFINSDATQAQMPLTWQLRDINCCVHGDEYKLHGVMKPVADEVIFDFAVGMLCCGLVACVALKVAETAAGRFKTPSSRPVQQKAAGRMEKPWREGSEPFKPSHP